MKSKTRPAICMRPSGNKWKSNDQNWHIDDLKISHCNGWEVTKIISGKEKLW